MDISYSLTKYQSNIGEITVLNSEETTIGTLKRFNDNQMTEKIGRHISSTFVSNVKAIDSQSDDIYKIQLKNQLKAFISTAEWTIEKNKEEIGSIKEKGVGKVLIIDLKEEKMKAKAEIGAIREIKFSRIDSDKETIVGIAKRNINIASPKMDIHIYEKDTSVPPILFAALSFIHNNQG